MTRCEECPKRLEIERFILESGDEIEVSYCPDCRIMYVDTDYEIR